MATVRVMRTGGNAGIAWHAVPTDDAPLLPDGTKLYDHPAAPAQEPQQPAIREDKGDFVWRGVTA